MSYKKVNSTEAKEAINRVASTEDGQIFLAVLQNECGFFSNIMSMEDPNKTQVFAAMRGVYGRIRGYIRPEYLLKAEYKTELIEDKDAFKKADKKTKKGV